MLIRPYRTDDAVQIVRLFHDTVHLVNRRDYAPAEIAAWAPRIPDPQAWDIRMRANRTLVADFDGEVGGFAELTMQGHVEMLFCQAGRIGTGVGQALHESIEEAARLAGMDRLTAHVSITARPFFERQGFRVLKERRVERGGVVLVNYAMAKSLEPSAGP
ncbi:MAG: GNAT family N-acetyltransferase [Alphaproteobacteria bacterium]|nr:GNAT family N-acetyltransferase [Alphaproteobacteria bacterium]